MVTRLDRVVNYIECVHNFFFANYRNSKFPVVVLNICNQGLAVATLNFNGREPATNAQNKQHLAGKSL